MDTENENQPTPVVFFDGKWLVGGLIAYFQQQRQKVHEQAPGISPALPHWCLDPGEIARFLGVPIQDLDSPSPGPTDNRLALERIEAKLNSLGVERGAVARAEYLSIQEAADVTRLSYSHVRRALLAGELPASNVGSALHAVYRIARSDLAAWMERKKGGNVVPPRSELKGLVNRYFSDP